MEILVASILLIVLVIISNIISHYLVAIPTALIEIVVGLLIAIVFNLQIDLESSWFMLLFVAPLLFNDGKLFPKNELWELRVPIFAYAILLVLLTTVVGGYFISWLIPDLPLPLAMALVAVLSPTDPVAVHGIAEQIKLPPKILSLISGESLINDASGLIAFKYALAAFTTGYFSLTQAAGDFFYITVVGVLVGGIFISLVHFLRLLLVQQGIQDVVLHTTIQIITPFVIYIVSDEVFHASGVIAVVAAGVLSINQTPIFRSQHSEVRLVTNKMWDMLVYLLNGIIFVLLGIELPSALSETIANPAIHNGTLLFYILAIWLMLLVVRVAWSYSYLWITYLRKSNPNDVRPMFITALMTGITGVRGAVTMATIMSMPFFLPDGNLFEQRALLISLACGVVLTSLIVATVTLPFLIKQKRRLTLVGDGISTSTDTLDSTVINNSSVELTELEARQLMVKHAILVLKKEAVETEHELIISDLVHEFETRLRHLYREHNDDETNRLYSQLEKQVQIVAAVGEKAVIQQLVANGDIPELLAKNYLKLVSTKELAFGVGLKNTFKRAFLAIRRQGNRWYWRIKSAQQPSDVPLGNTMLVKLEKESTQGAIDALRDYKKTMDATSQGFDLHKHIVNQKLHEYLHKLQRIKHFSTQTKEDYQSIVQEFYMRAIDAERETVQDLFRNNQITMSMANHLRQSLNYYESSLFQPETDH